MANFDFESYGRADNINNISDLLTPLNLLAVPTVTDIKKDKLAQRTADKQQKFEPAIMDSLGDADGPMFRGQQYADRGLAGDAYEVIKATPQKTQSYIDSKNGIAKYNRQRAQLSLSTGIPIDQVTNEMIQRAGMNERFDYLDAMNVNPDGSMQKDLIATTINSDGTGNIFGMGNKPLGIETTRYDSGDRDHWGKRALTNVTSLAGVSDRDVLGDKTILDAYDNQFKKDKPAGSVISGIGIKGNDTDGRIGEDIDIAQGAIAKFGADTVNMLTNLVGKDNIAKYDAWASEVEKKFDGDGETGWFLDKDDIAKIETMRDSDTAQKEFGVSDETLKQHQAAMAESEHMWVNAETPVDYIKSLAVGMSQLDRILAGSAGEIAALAIPGGPAVVAATRTSNYAEDYEKNNGKVMDKAKLAQTFFTELALLIPEKLLIKSGISDVVKKTAGKSSVGRILGAGAGEFAQEGGEAISEEVATQKEGARSVVDIATDPKTAHQAAIGFGMGVGTKGVGEVAGSVKGVATDKAANIATDLKAKAKAAKEKAIPTELSEAGTAVRAASHRTMADDYESTEEVPEIDPNDYAAGVVETHAKDLAEGATAVGVGTKVSTSGQTTNDNIDMLSANFDEAVEEIVEGLAVMKPQVEAKEAEGADISGPMAATAEISGEIIAELYQTRQDIVKEAKKSGSVIVEKLEVIDATIASLEPLRKVSSAADIDAVLASDATTSKKIRDVLGSSKASAEQLDQAIALAEDSTEVSSDEKALLKLQRELVGSEKVRAEKLIKGTAGRPSVVEWTKRLVVDKSEVAKEKVTNFVSGQQDKLDTANAAIVDYDKANNTYTVGAKPGVPVINLVKGSENYHKKQPLTKEEFDAHTPKQQANIRSTIQAELGNDFVKFDAELAGGTYDSIHSVADLQLDIAEEQGYLDSLQAIVDGTTSEVVEKVATEPVEAKIVDEGKSTQIEVEETPVEAEDVIDRSGAGQQQAIHDYIVSGLVDNTFRVNSASIAETAYYNDNKDAIEEDVAKAKKAKPEASPESTQEPVKVEVVEEVQTLAEDVKKPAEAPTEYLGTEQAIVKATELTSKIYEAGVANETSTAAYSETVSELMGLLNQSNLAITNTEATKIGKVLKDDNLTSNASKRVNNLLKYLAKGKKLTKAYRKSLEEFIPEVIANQAGKGTKHVKVTGTVADKRVSNKGPAAVRKSDIDNDPRSDKLDEEKASEAKADRDANKADNVESADTVADEDLRYDAEQAYIKAAGINEDAANKIEQSTDSYTNKIKAYKKVTKETTDKTGYNAEQEAMDVAKEQDIDIEDTLSDIFDTSEFSDENKDIVETLDEISKAPCVIN